MGPAFARRLPVPTAQGGKVGCWLHTPSVLILSIVHAIDRFVIRLNTHTGTIILDPLARLAAPTVTPIRRHSLDEHFIPAQPLHVVTGKEVALWLDLGQIVNVLSGAAELVHKD